MAKKRTRAANGMGTVRQRKDGLWEGRYTAPDGRQKSVYAKTEAEVTKKLRGALHEVDSGAWVEPSKMTVDDWLDIWLRDYQSHTTGRTVETYKNALRLHIRKTLGGVRMAKLTPVHFRRVVSDMQRDGYAPATIQHIRSIFGGAMRCAVEAGMLKANPVQGVKIPRKVKPEFTVVDRDMFPAFIHAAQDTRIPNALVFLLMTGLRAGELRGLKWDDIDFDAGTMRVERQLHSASVKSLAFGPPKDGSARTIQLPPDAVDLLKQQRRTQLEQRMSAGGDWVNTEYTNGLVFRTAKGGYITEDTLHRAVRAVGVAIDLPGLHPHDLRHSYAVAALRSGIDIKTVQNNLGHRSASMTLDTYAAYTTDAGKVGAERFAAYWQEALKNAD